MKTFAEESASYLELHDVYYVLHDLQKNLIKDQPADPIKYMIARLEAEKPLKLCLVGAPGTDRATTATALAKQFGIDRIDVEGLLKAKFPGEVETNLLAMDDEAIAVVKDALSKVSAKGYVLDGFPTTRVQARALQDDKELVDKFVVLQSDADATRTTLAAEIDALPLSNDKKADLVESRLQRYYRHLQSVTEAMKNVALEVDLTDTEGGDTVSKITNAVYAKTGDPRGPTRVCVVGPLGSGRSTQAAQTAKAFGAIHVNVNAMLGESPAELYADEDLCRIVGDRLRQTDCMQKGWVLDGFPNTVAQAEYLRKAHLWPSRVVHLSVSESVCLQRLALRRVDPVTGEFYYGNPPTAAIRQRLVQASSDKPEHVSERYHFHYDRHQDVLGVFSQLTTSIRGNQDPSAIHAAIIDYIRTPLTAAGA